jgi:hypothetical protein
VTKIDHDRPALKLIDDVKRRRAETGVSKVNKLEPVASTFIGSAAKTEAALIKARGTTLNAAIHSAACSVLTHVGKHRDIRLIDRLIAVVSDPVRANRLKAWFTTFGPAEFVEGQAKYRRGARTLLGRGVAKPFWKFKAKK